MRLSATLKTLMRLSATRTLFWSEWTPKVVAAVACDLAYVGVAQPCIEKSQHLHHNALQCRDSCNPFLLLFPVCAHICLDMHRQCYVDKCWYTYVRT